MLAKDNVSHQTVTPRIKYYMEQQLKELRIRIRIRMFIFPSNNIINMRTTIGLDSLCSNYDDRINTIDVRALERHIHQGNLP